MDSAIAKDGTQLQNNNFGTLYKAFTFIKQYQHSLKLGGKYEQVSTYISWKIPVYQNYKRWKEKYSSNEAFDC